MALQPDHRFVSDDEDESVPDMEAYGEPETISFLDLDQALDAPQRRRHVVPSRRSHINGDDFNDGDDDDDELSADDAHTTTLESGELLGSFELLKRPQHKYPVVAVRHIMCVTVGMAMANAALNAVFALYVNEYFGASQDAAISWSSAWNIVIWSAAPVSGLLADKYAGSFSTQRLAFAFWFLSAVASLITTVPEVAKFFDTSSPLAMSPDTIPLLSFAIIGATGQAIGYGVVNTLLPLFLGDQFIGLASERSQVFVYLYFSYNVGTLIGEVVAPILRQEESFLVCFVFVAASVWLAAVAYLSGTLAFRKVTRFAAPSENLLAALKRDFLSVTAIAKLYVALALFWALYVQLNSTFVFQARRLDRHVYGFRVPPDAVPAIEDVGVLLAIVFVDRVVDPLLLRFRVRPTPLRKIGCGLLICTLSFVAAGVLQIEIDRASASTDAPSGGVVSISVWWQVPQILLMSLSETLVIISGLQWGYAASPGNARPTVFALWSLSTALGATVVVSSAAVLPTTTPAWFFGYAAAMLLSTGCFVLLARRFA